MRQILFTEQIKGADVEILITPALFSYAKERQMVINLDEITDVISLSEVYLKIIYCGALNAWGVRRYDKPEMGDCPYNYMDFVVWGTNNPEMLGELIGKVANALSVEGKEQKKKASPRQ